MLLASTLPLYGVLYITAGIIVSSLMVNSIRMPPFNDMYSCATGFNDLLVS